MFPRDPDRVHPIARLQGCITMRIKKVVKQLHIELVVFNDKHRLARPQRGPVASLESLGALLEGHEPTVSTVAIVTL